MYSSNDDLSDFTTDQSEVNSDNEDNFQNNVIQINAMARQELTRNHIDIIPKYEGDPNTLSMYIGACEYLAVTFGNPQNPADAINGFLLRIFQSKLEGRALQLVGSREGNFTIHWIEETQQEFEEDNYEHENYTSLMEQSEITEEEPISCIKPRKTTTNMRITPASWSNQR
ncbi:hypothetical protein QE152_g4367 [Popillia japonica]|uniref:Uncharacterized protein n=1 Tax=Popillia japonica TaxID=7064 RepID=A0AAW1MYT3_POPJA